MFLVGPDTWGVQTDEHYTPCPETKGHCGDGGRCDGTPHVLSVGQPGYFAPPPPSLIMQWTGYRHQNKKMHDIFA